MSDIMFHRLRVSEVVVETADACSLVFELSPDQLEHFKFLTLRIPDSAGSTARCYSLSSSPTADRDLKITVKRMEGGYASNWICDNITPGAELDTLDPAGVFTPQSLDDDLLFFAGGSGITPIMSILKSMLASGIGTAVLVYANQNQNSIIFRDELARLAAQHPSRLKVLHWLESVQDLPDSDGLSYLVSPYTDRECFICGPRPFMDAVRKTLHGLGVPRARIHLERFASLAGNPFESAKPAVQPPKHVEDAAKIEIELNGEHHTFDWPDGVRLLDLLKEKGMDAPSSCSAGVCASCECRVVEGEVRMVNNQVLEEEDLAEGYVLACQALPVTDTVRIVYS